MEIRQCQIAQWIHVESWRSRRFSTKFCEYHNNTNVRREVNKWELKSDGTFSHGLLNKDLHLVVIAFSSPFELLYFSTK